MGSKRSKKLKQELEFYSEKNNIKNENGELPEPQPREIAESGNNGVALKAAKRKRKNNGEEVPKKIKKISEGENFVKKVRVKKNKPKNDIINNSIETEELIIKEEPSMRVEENDLDTSILNHDVVDINQIPGKTSCSTLEKKKSTITWPSEDVIELINRMESTIPEADSLAYRSRVEKLQWDNVTFKNYTSEECKRTWLQVQKRIRRYRILKEVLDDAKVWVSAPKVLKTNPKLNMKLPRPKKHPDMPRRPLSSYLLFYLTKKDEIISENPGLDGSDITKIVGQIYKNLPCDKRQQFEKQAASNREEYMAKLKVFFEQHPEYKPPQKLKLYTNKLEKEKREQHDKQPPSVEKPQIKTEKIPQVKSEIVKKKLKSEKVLAPEQIKSVKPPKEKIKGLRKPGRPPKSGMVERPPKKCQTPFGLYFASEMKSVESGTEKSAFRAKCKQQYRQMPDKSKVHWINLAEQDLVRYQEEIKVYKTKYPNFKVHKIRSILTKREKASKERASGKPIKPPNSAYALFSKVMLQSEEIKSIHPKDRMNYIASKWKTVPEEEQNNYRDQVVTLMERYRQEYQAYVDSLPEDEKRKIANAAKRKKGRTGRSSGRIKKMKKRKVASKIQDPKMKFTEPEQPPISACKYFASVYTGEGDPVQAWKALCAEERKKYEEELVKKKQAYIVEFERFLKSLSKEELEAFSKSRQQQVPSDDEEEETSDCSSGSAGEGDDDDDDDDDEDDEVNNELAETQSEIE